MSDRLINLTRVNHGRHGVDTVFGEAFYTPGGICGPRIQQDWQIVILLSGSGVSHVGGEVREFAPGQATLQVPGQHETVVYAAESPTHHTWVAVKPEAVPADLSAALHAAPKVIQVSDSLSKIMDMVMAQPRYEGPLNTRWMDHMGLAALLSYLCVTESSSDLRQQSVVELAIRHMEQHLADAECLATAAMAASVTPQHLARRFQAEIGLPPSEWLWRLRLERASDFLLHSGLSVGEIAQRCGFKTIQHFSRRFLEQFGRSPAKHRRNAWSAPVKGM